jgi:hypothetical protein
MKLDMVILISVAAIGVIGLIVYFVIKSREKFVPYWSNNNMNSMNSEYSGSAAPGNPAFYKQLGPYKGCDASPVVVTPDMMQLPEPTFGPGFYAGALNWIYDPVSGIPVQMYTSPRVPLSDFQTELTRCGCCETENCKNCCKN